MYVRKVYTLVFLREDSRLLLGLKKRGFGINKWNGFGGKLEPEETVIDAAARELKEECCINAKASDLKHIGNLEFTFEGESTLMDVKVFTSKIFNGEPQETDEMRPRWFNIDALPFEEMWPDDRIWFPYMLNSKLFFAQFHYKGFDSILKYNIVELHSVQDLYKNH
ncbi:unnamed protein product [Leptosia nina]|uniref:Oxidized purine nucleoside triphosphate hydrolase n=1 Tax=Leptosia nina TaxID=320188 RepID=A0AAV1JEH9_9NEOP